MKPYYIILTDSGERFDLSKANEFNPNEFAWINPNDLHAPVVLVWDSKDLEGYCYMQDPDDDPNDPVIGVTLAFSAYDSADNMICQAEGGTAFWL